MAARRVQRRLVLVRHAEAAAALIDRDRPLTARGDGRRSGRRLARPQRVVPDRVLGSPARRTLQTWDRMRAALPSAAERVVDERIYDNAVDGLLGLLRDAPRTC